MVKRSRMGLDSIVCGFKRFRGPRADERPSVTMAGMKSRWFRFSLRTLLLLIAVLCVWLGIQVNAARRQREAVAAIQSAGGSVVYDYEIVPRPPTPVRTRSP